MVRGGRITKTNVLKHELRKLLYETLKENGPSTISDIKSVEEGIRKPQARYHLRMLKKKGLVASSEIRGETVYRLRGQGFDEDIEELKRSEPRLRLLEYVVENPDSLQTKISRDLDKSLSTINLQMAMLEKSGFLEKERDGRKTLYEASEKGLEAYEKLVGSV